MWCDTLHYVPIPDTNILDLLQEYQVMGPAQMFDGKSKIILFQLRNHWLRNWSIRLFHYRKLLIIFIEKLYHALHIAHGATFYLGIIVPQVHSQPLQGLFAPTVGVLALL